MAKFYVAKKYVKVSGDYVAVPGEVIELDMPKKEIDRLLRKGAIKEAENIAGIPYPDDDVSTDNAPNAEDDSTAEDDSEAEDESKEPDPDEIDVMDGISQPKGKTARKSKK